MIETGSRDDKLKKYLKLCKMSLIIEWVIFFLIAGVHNAIEKRRMGDDLKEHMMTVVDVEKSVSVSTDSRHKSHSNYKVRYAVMINGEKTWFYSNNSQLDYVAVDNGSKVKIYEYNGKYSTKRDTFTITGPYRIILIIDIVALMFSILLTVGFKLESRKQENL